MHRGMCASRCFGACVSERCHVWRGPLVLEGLCEVTGILGCCSSEPWRMLFIAAASEAGKVCSSCHLCELESKSASSLFCFL